MNPNLRIPYFDLISSEIDKLRDQCITDKVNDFLLQECISPRPINYR